MRLIPYFTPWTTREFYSPDDPPAGDPPKGDKADDELGEKGKQALDRERDARKKAEKDLSTLQESVTALQKFKDDTEAAAQQAAADRAKAQGQFEQVAKDAEAARDAAKAELAKATETITALQEAISTGLDDSFKALPEKVQKLYKGGEDDVLAKFRFVHDPDMAEIVKDLAGGRPEANNGNQNPVDPANPNAPKMTEEQKRAAQAPMYSSGF